MLALLRNGIKLYVAGMNFALMLTNKPEKHLSCGVPMVNQKLASYLTVSLDLGRYSRIPLLCLKRDARLSTLIIYSVSSVKKGVLLTK